MIFAAARGGTEGGGSKAYASLHFPAVGMTISSLKTSAAGGPSWPPHPFAENIMGITG
jgi:hypothetical protein